MNDISVTLWVLQLSAACNFGHSEQIKRPDVPVYSRYGM